MKRTYIIKNIVTLGRNIHIVDDEVVINDIGYCEKYSYNVEKTWFTDEDFFNSLGTISRKNDKFSLSKFGIFFNRIFGSNVFSLEFYLNDWYMKRIPVCKTLVLKIVNSQNGVSQVYTFKIDRFDVDMKRRRFILTSLNDDLVRFIMNFFADAECRKTQYELIFNFIP